MTDPVDALASAIRAGQRAALARAITLVESTRADHEASAQALLGHLLASRGEDEVDTLRLGITGVPGAGKSTLIEALGLQLVSRGHRVAVLAIDPTSALSGGSILGDKTRMGQLSVHPAAFVRPSPSAGTLGGVARRTREAMLLCEAAGYDVVIIETVGVGQAEVVAADMVDFFFVLALAGAGDELQGIKRGVLELADLVAINKADGDNEPRARRAAAELRRAMHLLTPPDPDWRAPVMPISALSGEGLDELWAQVERHREIGTARGVRATKRAAQRVRWMWRAVEDRLMGSLRDDEAVGALVAELEQRVASGALPPTEAAAQVLATYRG